MAPVTIRSHLTVYLSQSDKSHSVLTKQQNGKRILLEKNSLYCFIISVWIRHVIFLWYIVCLIVCFTAWNGFKVELRKTKTFAIMANDYYDYDKFDNRFKLKDIHNLRC